MKVIHVAYSFHPDSIGGTEIYVETLAKSLQTQGVDCVVAAPATSSNGSSYFHDNLKVRRFSISQREPALLLAELYGAGDAMAAAEFAHILDEERPDIVHLHAFTRGCSILLVHEAKARGILVAFTYHTPTVSCQRGTLLQWGNEICDGLLDVRKCTACTLNDLGLGKAAASSLAFVPPAIGNLLATAGLSGGLWTALRMPQLIKTRQSAFYSLMLEADCIVVLCDWTRDLLQLNGITGEKIMLSRHGIGPMNPERLQLSEPAIGPQIGARNSVALRMAFLGRLHPTKGVDLLILAIKTNPGLAVELHIYGLTPEKSDDAYVSSLVRLAQGDSRIHFEAPVPPNDVVGLLTEYDLLAVPSRCLETGPLVVLSAFAAGIPVVGSNLGGIAELVEAERNGLLIEPDSVEAWGDVIGRCIKEPGLLSRLQAGTCPPRNMDRVAREMRQLYERMLASRELNLEFPNPV